MVDREQGLGRREWVSAKEGPAEYTPHVEVFDDPRQVDHHAADAIAARARLKKHPVIVGPTGNTPKEMWDELVRRQRARSANLSSCYLVNLDEYYPIDPRDPASFASYMRERLINAIGLPRSQWVIPDGLAEDPAMEAAAIEGFIARRGIDHALVGVGQNGHLGFNEPGSPHDSRTRLVDLTPETRAANSGAFPHPDLVPYQAITLGIGTINEAGSIDVIAKGPSKADAIKAALEGPITTDLPLSAVRSRPKVRFLLDRQAASKLS